MRYLVSDRWNLLRVPYARLLLKEFGQIEERDQAHEVNNKPIS